MRTYPRRYSGRTISAGTDLAIWGFPIPPGGTLNRLHFDTHVIGQEESEVIDAMMYGLGVWLIPLADMDDTSSLDSVWNEKVPKDEAETESGFNLDEVGDSQPEFAAGGELDWNSIFEITEGQSVEIFRRRKMLSAADGATGYIRISAATDLFTPVDSFKGKVNKRYHTKAASMVIAGFSSPALDVTQVPAADLVPTEKQWVQLSFLDDTLHQALMSAIGLVVSGTQEPYSEALAWIARYLEPAISQDATSIFQSGTYRVFSKVSADITIPNKNIGGHLSSE